MFVFFVGHSSGFLFDTYTLMHEMSSGQFLTKDIFFREFELKKMGEGLKEAYTGLNKQNTIHKKIKCSMQTFHILDAF